MEEDMAAEHQGYETIIHVKVPCGAGILPASFQALPARTSTPTGGWANVHPAGHIANSPEYIATA